MLRILSMTLSLVAVIIIQFLANSFSFNGKTTIEIMNRLPILFTPASYVFSIWFLIYAFLFIWLYDFYKTQRQYSNTVLNKRTFWFIASASLTILWLLLWQYEFFAWTIFTMLALLVSLTNLYFTYPKEKNGLFQRIPISIFLSWVTISFIELIIYVLTFYEWSGWGLSDSLWTVIFLTIATAIALHFTRHYRDVAFNVVFMWLFIGIFVKNGLDSLFVSMAALFLTLVLTAGLIFVKKRL